MFKSNNSIKCDTMLKIYRDSFIIKFFVRYKILMIIWKRNLRNKLFIIINKFIYLIFNR